MIPTLSGRWQTRIFLLVVLGIPVTLLYTAWQIRYHEGSEGLEFGVALRTPLVILGYVLVLGLFWDVFYLGIQRTRWDRDWPFAFQFLAGIWEGLVLRLILFQERIDLPFLPEPAELDRELFLIHYAAVFLVTFLAVFGPLKIFFPTWRYHGGQFVGR